MYTRVVLTKWENGDSNESVISLKLFEIELNDVHFWRLICLELSGLKSKFVDKKKFRHFHLSESLFFIFLYILFTASCRTCDCVWMRTYLPTYGSLFEKSSSANKKYTYKKIDTYYCRQTASATPSAVKAYVAQSPLHLSYLWQKSKFTSYPWNLPLAYFQNFADN